MAQMDMENFAEYRRSGDKSDFYDTKGKILPVPGARWHIGRNLGEGALTGNAMKAYEANNLGGWRNPFPIYISTNGEAIAKPFIVQLFRGRKENAEPFEVYDPRKTSLKKFIDDLDWVGALEGDPNFAAEVKMSFLFPCSTAYDKAMRQLYVVPVNQALRRLRREDRVPKSWEPMIKQLGITGRPPPYSRKTPWTVKEWWFILSKLKFREF